MPADVQLVPLIWMLWSASNSMGVAPGLLFHCRPYRRVFLSGRVLRVLVQSILAQLLLEHNNHVR